MSKHEHVVNMISIAERISALEDQILRNQLEDLTARIESLEAIVRALGGESA